MWRGASGGCELLQSAVYPDAPANAGIPGTPRHSPVSSERTQEPLLREKPAVFQTNGPQMR